MSFFFPKQKKLTPKEEARLQQLERIRQLRLYQEGRARRKEQEREFLHHIKSKRGDRNE